MWNRQYSTDLTNSTICCTLLASSCSSCGEIVLLLKDLRAQSAFLILRQCLNSSNKFGFLLRTIDPSLIREELERTDTVWKNGLGLKIPSELAEAAYIGSCLGVYKVLGDMFDFRVSSFNAVLADFNFHWEFEAPFEIQGLMTLLIRQQKFLCSAFEKV
jgi:hypothetical protein